MLLFALAVVVFLAWSALQFSIGFGFRDFIRPTLQSLTGRTQLSASIDAIRRAPGRWLRAHLDGIEPEKLRIDIKFKNLHKIHQKREAALARGLLVTAADDMVPAQIRHGDRTVRVKLRLKGDLTDHLEGDKWSFRIKTRGGDALLGMRRFSIQAPHTRGFQGEPLFLETLRWLGVLAPRYFFVDVEVNGRDIGLMALEEHFDKVLLERQGRREGVILKFDESNFWEQFRLSGDHGAFENFQLAFIDAFGTGSIEESPTLQRDLAKARSLLRGFVTGALPASDVFDEKLLGSFLAACEVWGAFHPCRWHNLRLYFNPIDQELEPIGFDGNLQTTWLEPTLLTMQEPITRAFLDDPAVAEAFVEALHQLADGLGGGELLAQLRKLEDENLRILHQEFPLRAPIDFAAVQQRAFELKSLTPDHLADFTRPPHSATSPYGAVVVANLIRQDAGATLELASPLPWPVTVEEVRLTGEGVESDLAPDGTLPGFPRVLPATSRGAAPDWQRIWIPVTAGLEGIGIEGSARVKGQNQSRPFTARAYDPIATQPPLPEATVEATLKRHRFLRRTPDPTVLMVRKGSWRVEESIVLPTGIALRIGAGTKLRFAPDAVLVVRGPTTFEGTEREPIEFEPLRPEEPWPGLVVLNAGSPSSWTHVQVRNTRGFVLDDWVLTGATTFYRSKVTLTHCRFEWNTAEDALNIISSEFVLDDVSVLDTASDGFDGDFSRGEIRGGHFARIGGDGIDVSGSTVKVSGTRLEDIGDKAISIGEASSLEATGLEIDRVGTAIVAKDRSEGTVRASRIGTVRFAALMAYVKKPEYGPASLTVEDVSVGSAQQLAVAQFGSWISIDGERVTEQEFDAEAAYDGGYMKKE